MKQLVAVIHSSKPYKRRRLKLDPEHREARRAYRIRMRHPDERRKLRLYTKRYIKKNKQALKRRQKFLQEHSNMKHLRQPQLVSFSSISGYKEILAMVVKVPGRVTAGVDSDGIERQTLSERSYGPGIVCKDQLWNMANCGMPDKDLSITVCYSEIDGGYIGEPKVADVMLKYGIRPQRAGPDDNVCSIGLSDKDGKWYGWSHRAMFNFGIGDEYYWPDTCFDGPGSKQPKRIINTVDEAKESAINFAEDVS